MLRSRHLLPLGLLALLGACAHPAAPVTAPQRAAQAAPPPPADSARVSAARDTAPALAAVRGVSPDEVKRRAREVFGDSVVLAEAPPAAADSDEVDEGLAQAAYASNERVAYYVDAFSGRARERIETWLERGTRYEGMIRERFRRAGLPEDFVYLALIESGYDPNAYSRAAAVGMWQFMAPTARGMGLRVDWWVDERRDPVKSTDAAARFLGYLNEQFGSFYLAAAAYNGGPGRVARGLAKYADDLDGTTGDDAFFALAEKEFLPRETKDYVPQLIAAAIVAHDPARYGLSVQPRPAYAFDSVRVPAATPLAAVAKAAGARTADVVELNPHVLRGVTPPNGALWVRVPVGAAASFEEGFRRLDVDERRAFTRVESKKKQSLASIARAHGLSARQLAWYNQGLATLKSGNLRPGQTVLVPTSALVAAAHDVPDPSGDRAERARGARAKGPVLHVVAKGETLSHVAKRYGLTVTQVMRLNGLRKQIIFPGQALVVSGKVPPSAASLRAAKADLRRESKGAKVETRVARAEKASPRTKEAKEAKVGKAGTEERVEKVALSTTAKPKGKGTKSAKAPARGTPGRKPATAVGKAKPGAKQGTAAKRQVASSAPKKPAAKKKGGEPLKRRAAN